MGWGGVWGGGTTIHLPKHLYKHTFSKEYKTAGARFVLCIIHQDYALWKNIRPPLTLYTLVGSLLKSLRVGVQLTCNPNHK